MKKILLVLFVSLLVSCYESTVRVIDYAKENDFDELYMYDKEHYIGIRDGDIYLLNALLSTTGESAPPATKLYMKEEK